MQKIAHDLRSDTARQSLAMVVRHADNEISSINQSLYDRNISFC